MTTQPSSTGSGSDTNHPEADLGRLLELAVKLAREAGQAVIGMRSGAVTTATTKSSPTDPVTAADAAAERIIVDGIVGRRPTDGIVSEEGADRSGHSSVVWFVDPIDGTTNYLYGIPAYSVSIAAAIDGITSIGVVLNPVTDELFTAVIGGGAHLNGRPLAVNTQTELDTALVGTGFGYRSDRRLVQAEILRTVLPRIRDIRRFGSAALDLCAVAAGRIDGYYESGLNVWDYGAGQLIVEEAGGVCRVVAPNGHEPEWLFAAGPALVDPLQHLVETAPTNHR